jgi:hypothetical protein
LSTSQTAVALGIKGFSSTAMIFSCVGDPFTGPADP